MIYNTVYLFIACHYLLCMGLCKSHNANDSRVYGLYNTGLYIGNNICNTDNNKYDIYAQYILNISSIQT